MLGELPEELLALPHWAVWAWIDSPERGGPVKVPLTIGGRWASSVAASDWTTIEEIKQRIDRINPETTIEGLAFLFYQEKVGADGLIGIDLDDSRDPTTGVLTPLAAEVVRAAGTYAEVSPSGKGVKLWGRGRLPAINARRVNRSVPIEIYTGYTQTGRPGGRFFAVTGRRLEACPRLVTNIQPVIDLIYRRMFPPPIQATPAAIEWNRDSDLLKGVTDKQIIARLRRTESGHALWTADAHHPSASESDLALCGIIAYYTGPDPQRIERIFTQSSLGLRAKWVGRADYRQRTIARALEGRDPNNPAHWATWSES